MTRKTRTSPGRSPAARTESVLEAGQEAPDFTLPDQNGDEVTLSDLRGQTVVLYFYPRADTPGCTAQACGFRDQFPAIEAGNAVVLGLSPDRPEALLAWKQSQALPYDLLSDPDHKVLDDWGVWGEQTFGAVKYMGVARSHWVIGEDGTVLDEQIKVSPTQSVERATSALTG